MIDILGFTLESAYAALECSGQGLPVRTSETSGYRALEGMENHTDIRVVGVRENTTEIVLITARF